MRVSRFPFLQHDRERSLQITPELPQRLILFPRAALAESPALVAASTTMLSME